MRRDGLWLITRQVQRSLYKINNEAGDLRSKNVEIIGEKNEYDPRAKANTILPEIFIDSFQVLHGPQRYDVLI